MKKAVAVLCAALAACNSPHSKETPRASDSKSQSSSLAAQAVEAEPVSAMLKEGKPESCSAPAVKERILSDVNEGIDDNPTPAKLGFSDPGYTQQDADEAFLSVGEPILKDTQAVESDSSVHSFTCAVTVQLGTDEKTVEYQIKPSLDDPHDFLLGYAFGHTAKGFRKTAVGIATQANRLKRSRAAEAAKQPTEPEVINAM